MIFKDPDSGYGLYLDAALTVPLAGPLLCAQRSDSSTPPIEHRLYVGSPQGARVLKAASNPGADQIVAGVVDAASGSGHAAGEVKLALTQGGLAGAIGGASLNLGTAINSLAAGAISLWLQVDDVTGVVGLSTELSVQLNSTVAD